MTSSNAKRGTGTASALRRAAWGLALGFFLVLILAPFAVMVLTAAKPLGEVATHPLLPATWQPQNLITVWSSDGGALRTFFRNSLVLAFGSTALTLALALPAAYALARMPVPGAKLFRHALLATQMFAPIVVVGMMPADAIGMLRICAIRDTTRPLPEPSSSRW